MYEEPNQNPNSQEEVTKPIQENDNSPFPVEGYSLSENLWDPIYQIGLNKNGIQNYNQSVRKALNMNTGKGSTISHSVNSANK